MNSHTMGRVNMKAKNLYKMKILEQLLQGIKNEEFYVLYQPQVEISTGEVVRLEALIRRKDSEGNEIVPNLFIPLYEKD